MSSDKGLRISAWEHRSPFAYCVHGEPESVTAPSRGTEWQGRDTATRDESTTKSATCRHRSVESER